jgi:hypothetical protein
MEHFLERRKSADAQKRYSCPNTRRTQSLHRQGVNAFIEGLATSNYMYVFFWAATFRPIDETAADRLYTLR